MGDMLRRDGFFRMKNNNPELTRQFADVLMYTNAYTLPSIPKGTQGVVKEVRDGHVTVSFRGKEYNFREEEAVNGLLKPCTIELARMQADNIADSVSSMIKGEISKILFEKDKTIKAKDGEIEQLQKDGKIKDAEIEAKDVQIKDLKRKLKDLKGFSDKFVTKRQALGAATREYAKELDDLQERIASMAE